MNCEVCPVDTIAKPATKRVAFAPVKLGEPLDHERIRGAGPQTYQGDVFFCCASCAKVAEKIATITDISPEGASHAENEEASSVPEVQGGR